MEGGGRDQAKNRSPTIEARAGGASERREREARAGGASGRRERAAHAKTEKKAVVAKTPRSLI